MRLILYPPTHEAPPGAPPHGWGGIDTSAPLLTATACSPPCLRGHGIPYGRDQVFKKGVLHGVMGRDPLGGVKVQHILQQPKGVGALIITTVQGEEPIHEKQFNLIAKHTDGGQTSKPGLATTTSSTSFIYHKESSSHPCYGKYSP